MGGDAEVEAERTRASNPLTRLDMVDVLPIGATRLSVCQVTHEPKDLWRVIWTTKNNNFNFRG